jgi:hypothetical protein
MSYDPTLDPYYDPSTGATALDASAGYADLSWDMWDLSMDAQAASIEAWYHDPALSASYDQLSNDAASWSQDAWSSSWDAWNTYDDSWSSYDTSSSYDSSWSSYDTSSSYDSSWSTDTGV